MTYVDHDSAMARDRSASYRRLQQTSAADCQRHVGSDPHFTIPYVVKMKLSLLALTLVPASAFVSQQRAFTRSTTVANAQPSEKDLELTRKVIMDFINSDGAVAEEPKAEEASAEPAKKKKSKKEAVAEEA